MQSAEGWFIRSGQASYGEGGASGDDVAFTSGDFDGNAELVVWLALIASNLLARDA
jgi:hypothetical protein